MKFVELLELSEFVEFVEFVEFKLCRTFCNILKFLEEFEFGGIIWIFGILRIFRIISIFFNFWKSKEIDESKEKCFSELLLNKNQKEGTNKMTSPPNNLSYKNDSNHLNHCRMKWKRKWQPISNCNKIYKQTFLVLNKLILNNISRSKQNKDPNLPSLKTQKNKQEEKKR